MAVKIQSTPVQAFSADFDLQGDATTGSLTLNSPLGTTVARMQWTPASAVLHTTGTPQYFDSLQALTRQATGVELPIESLFSWLQGANATAPGWEVDLHELPEGRLVARRLDADAPAELKIILEP